MKSLLWTLSLLMAAPLATTIGCEGEPPVMAPENAASGTAAAPPTSAPDTSEAETAAAPATTCPPPPCAPVASAPVVASASASAATPEGSAAALPVPPVIAEVAGNDRDQALTVGNGNGLELGRIDQRKDHCVQADAERERRNNGGGKPPVGRNHAQREPEIVSHTR